MILRFVNVALGLSLAVSAITVAANSSLGIPTRPFDAFGDIKCEDEMARLDNFAVGIMNWPNSKGLILFYGGRHFRGRFPKRGEAAARAARLREYLVNRRGIPRDQLLIIDAGYTEGWHVQLWFVPQGAPMPERESTIPIDQIKFRRGNPNLRDFRCHV